MRVSVLITTYNRPQELLLSLTSLLRQSRMPDEIVVADDGSTDETRRMLDTFRQQEGIGIPIRHVWHEDQGFRRSAILNRAAVEAAGEYLIFSDGDCLFHRDFVSNHLRSAADGVILSGKRVDLGKRFTERLLASGRVVNGLTPGLLWDSIRGNTRKIEEGVVISFPWLWQYLKRDRIRLHGVYGCNCSLPRDLFLAINGFDEDFKFAVEDNDLGVRVVNSGGSIRSVRARAVVYHLWHPSRWRVDDPRFDHDQELMHRHISLKESVCGNGVRKL